MTTRLKGPAGVHVTRAYANDASDNWTEWTYVGEGADHRKSGRV